jgi:IclR family pca regulon transcriptional regulator
VGDVNENGRAEGDLESGEFVIALQRGLDVLRAFGRDTPVLTLTQVAQLTGLSRGTSRRLLHTLVALGYIRMDGREFRLTPRVLDIGYSYLAALDLVDLVREDMDGLARRTGESSSVAVLDRDDVVYVARAPASRIMSVALGLGSRLPAYCTSLGRVLLAGLRPAELEGYLADVRFEPLTSRTITDREGLRTELDRVRAQGWALVDQELEIGVRSMAAPLHNRTGCTVAAINVSAHAGRVTLDAMRHDFLPPLLGAAGAISQILAKRM